MPLRPHGAGASKKGDDKMKKPRLTDADRLAIETGLRSGKTVYMIAKELSRPVTTITREIRARAVESDKGAAYRVTNRCAFRMECQRRDICAHCLYDGKRQCRFCRQCNSHCQAFVEQKCGRLESSKDEIPKSFILYEKDGACKVCISQLSTLSLCTRAKKSEM